MEKTEKRIKDRRIVLTAGLGILAVIIALVVIFLSTGEVSLDAVIWGVMIIALLAVLTAVKTGRKKEYNYFGAAFGALMVFAGIAISAFSFFGSGEIAGSGMITGGFILLFICLISLKRPADRDIRDERSLKIGTWAISYSWYLTFFAVIVMFWLSYLDVVVIKAESALGVLIFLMPLSTVFFQWYFSKKGDVY